MKHASKIMTAEAFGAVAAAGLSAAPASAAAPAHAETIVADPHGHEEYGSDLGEIWNCVWAVGPIDCGTAKGAATDAENATVEEVNAGVFDYDSMHNGKADAFRHCYWNALMVDRIDYEQAEAVATAHEEKPGQPFEEKLMDLENNHFGRNIGAATPSEQAARDSCRYHAVQGSLKTLK
ncbi:DUF6973 domain-containing protein [Glycomyces rhizosphaerae]|uniref:DUF6973 domain-containing protein n=1 Tax=Glycomyces rhizosphaerae TaxID=2054422 RepID=A0ABV7Q1C5_9ACTN